LIYGCGCGTPLAPHLLEREFVPEMEQVMTYEVNRGELKVNGAAIPLRRGLILLALARAGWRGADGILTEEFARRLVMADPRIGIAGLALPH
jgi:hypothetical protein